ncbi:hypothetical protein C8R44DRAFT_878697 [Mycena epipterygia]|nr:hypothetical protein C8R44DRAFT_878697 [Mycena epipterygia]
MPRQCAPAASFSPDRPERWYSQSAYTSFPSPTRNADVEGTVDGIAAKQIDEDERDDIQSQAGSTNQFCRCALDAKTAASADSAESTPFPLPVYPLPFPLPTSPPMSLCPRCGVWQELHPPPSPRYLLSPVTTWRTNSSGMFSSHENVCDTAEELR